MALRQKWVRGRAAGEGPFFRVAELLTGYLKHQNPDLTGWQFHVLRLTGYVFLQVVFWRKQTPASRQTYRTVVLSATGAVVLHTPAITPHALQRDQG